MSDQSRRKLLKSIAAGSGAVVAGKSLPNSWSRPVVDSVLLPAHAQTSGCTAVDDYFENTTSPNGQSYPAPGVLENDTCTQVVSNTPPVITSVGTVTIDSLTVNPDGSFSYTASSGDDVIFTFTYTTESGATATVTVNQID